MSIEILPYTKLLSTFSKFNIIPIFFLMTRELPLKKKNALLIFVYTYTVQFNPHIDFHCHFV